MLVILTSCPTLLEMGHTSRGCKQDRTEVERVEVRCVNCNQGGHRARDCVEKRVDRYACRNCGYVTLLSLHAEAGL